MFSRRGIQGGAASGSFAKSAVLVSTRSVIQSKGFGGGLRSPLDRYADEEVLKKLRSNSRGNYYRFQSKLWPSQEAMEKELTEIMYEPVERAPLALLPQRSRSRPQQLFACEGRGGTILMERITETLTQQDESTREETKPNVQNPAEEDENMMEALLAQQSDAPSIYGQIITEGDVEGTMLASAQRRARHLLADDLSVNSTNVESRQEPPQKSTDPAGISWDGLGLDPLLSDAAAKAFGPTPTRLQSRLLPALLHEDHNDVLFNGVTGSGKTAALLLATLHGVRNESAGFNVLVAADTQTAMRLHDGLRTLCRKSGLGGQLVDRPTEDYSWMLIGTFREDAEKYYKMLRRSLRGPHGPARVFITTADVMCELLFEKKMEFEEFGYLRRIYVDDVGAQIPMLSDDAPTPEIKERVRNPLAAELLLGTLHQLPGPHIRSILQLGLVSADVDGKLKTHLQSLCMKPDAQTTVIAPVRIPSTVHCLFSFHLFNQDRFEYLVKLVWRARSTIPGRAIIFVKDTEDVLGVRRRLRAQGMNAHIFSEVYGNGEFQEKWKFLILKESEGFGIDIPLVSHVFISFAPTTWQRYLHMCGRTGRLGNVGWAYTICDQREMKQVRRTAEDLSVDFVHHVVDDALQLRPFTDVQRMSKEPELYGLDPQYAVKQHYEVQADNPDVAYVKRELFTKPANKQFQMEDYTPIPVKQHRFENAQKLARDVEKNPGIAVEMHRRGLMDSQMKPTKKLKRMMNAKTSKLAPDPFRRPRF